MQSGCCTTIWVLGFPNRLLFLFPSLIIPAAFFVLRVPVLRTAFELLDFYQFCHLAISSDVSAITFQLQAAVTFGLVFEPILPKEKRLTSRP